MIVDDVADFVPNDCHQMLNQANVLKHLLKDDQFASLSTKCHACDHAVGVTALSIDDK